MAVIIGSARHDEFGKLSGGAAGDQKQKIGAGGLDWSGEVSVQNYYNNKSGWVGLRAKDPNLAAGLAFCMVVACNNANIGYDQANRLGVYKNGVDTKVKTETDCSGLIRACLKQCGHNVSNFTTSNEKAVLLATGLFTEVKISKASDCCDGDILVTKSKGHTVIVVSGGKSRGWAKEVNPWPRPSKPVTSAANAKARKIKSYVSSGDEVKWVQFELRQVSAEFKKQIDANGGVDGKCGSTTVNYITLFQIMYGLTRDGVAGSKTCDKLAAV